MKALSAPSQSCGPVSYSRPTPSGNGLAAIPMPQNFLMLQFPKRDILQPTLSFTPSSSPLSVNTITLFALD